MRETMERWGLDMPMSFLMPRVRASILALLCTVRYERGARIPSSNSTAARQ